MTVPLNLVFNNSTAIFSTDGVTIRTKDFDICIDTHEKSLLIRYTDGKHIHDINIMYFDYRNLNLLVYAFTKLLKTRKFNKEINVTIELSRMRRINAILDGIYMYDRDEYYEELAKIIERINEKQSIERIEYELYDNAVKSVIYLGIGKELVRKYISTKIKSDIPENIQEVHIGAINGKEFVCFMPLYSKDVGYLLVYQDGMTYIHHVFDMDDVYYNLIKKKRKYDDLTIIMSVRNKSKDKEMAEMDIKRIITTTQKLIKTLEVIRDMKEQLMKEVDVKLMNDIIEKLKKGFRNRINKLGVEIAQALI